MNLYVQRQNFVRGRLEIDCWLFRLLKAVFSMKHLIEVPQRHTCDSNLGNVNSKHIIISNWSQRLCFVQPCNRIVSHRQKLTGLPSEIL